MKYIQTNNAPAAIGPYSQAIVANDFIYCSGQIGLDSQGVLVEGLEKQVNQVMSNIKAVLHEAGSDLEHVVKTTIYVKNISDFARVNEIYGRYFSMHKPTRATIEVSNLPKGALVEIEAVAVTV